MEVFTYLALVCKAQWSLLRIHKAVFGKITGILYWWDIISLSLSLCGIILWLISEMVRGLKKSLAQVCVLSHNSLTQFKKLQISLYIFINTHTHFCSLIFSIANMKPCYLCYLVTYTSHRHASNLEIVDAPQVF